MIEISIDPVVAIIAGYELRWYGIISAIGVALAVFLPYLWARGRDVGVTKEQVLEVAPWAVLGGIIFSRLLHVIDQWHLYRDNPWDIFGFQGMSIFGAIVGATLVGVLYAKIRNFPIGRMADLTAPWVILAQAVGRIGCIINGCCYGTPTSLPWGVFYTHPDSMAFRDGVTGAVHPTHAYELIFDVLVFGLLWFLRGRLKREGALFLTYLCVYSFGRFFITMLRANDPFLFGLIQAQVVSIVVLLVCIPWFIWLYRRPKPELAEAKAPSDEAAATSQSAEDE